MFSTMIMVMIEIQELIHYSWDILYFLLHSEKQEVYPLVDPLNRHQKRNITHCCGKQTNPKPVKTLLKSNRGQHLKQ